MLLRFPHALFCVLSIIAIGFLAGCGPTSQEPVSQGTPPVAEAEDDYDPHDVPITEEQKAELREQTAQFPNAVAMIKQLGNEVGQETAAGIPENPFKAHQALDKADLVLQWLPEIARDSGIGKEQWETINTSANDLRTLFEQVHQNIDNQQYPNFAAVADQIDQKIAGLEQIAAGQSAGAGVAP